LRSARAAQPRSDLSSFFQGICGPACDILVDIGLGEESGFDLARLLTQDGRAGGAEVILISTGAEADYRELIDESPAAGFLAKSELSARNISGILDHTP
jgi:hypothetical protein